ncbi:MAG: hypothetical protein IT374_28145 [Polyangiaceae bacterium]|nr:hypothetical protein [Polyangiaceae bacterium]
MLVDTTEADAEVRIDARRRVRERVDEDDGTDGREALGATVVCLVCHERPPPREPLPLDAEGHRVAQPQVATRAEQRAGVGLVAAGGDSAEEGELERSRRLIGVRRSHQGRCRQRECDTPHDPHQRILPPRPLVSLGRGTTAGRVKIWA